ncbi:hypothetical protein ACSMXM_03050 [Pacificimonas sp. ICDLI1SI03]
MHRPSSSFANTPNEGGSAPLDMTLLSTVDAGPDNYLRSEAEIAASATIFDHVAAGRTLILLAGFPGVGKSALLRRIERDWATHFGAILLAARGAALGGMECQTPDLLLVDEAEDLDDAGRDCLSERVTAGRPSIIVAARPDDVRALPPGAELTIVRLDPLTPEEVARLATALCGDLELSGGTLRRISLHAEGRPRLVRSLLRSAAIEATLENAETVEPYHVDLAAARLALRNQRRMATDDPAMSPHASVPLARPRGESEISLVERNENDGPPQGPAIAAISPQEEGRVSKSRRGKAFGTGAALIAGLAASYVLFLAPQPIRPLNGADEIGDRSATATGQQEVAALNRSQHEVAGSGEPASGNTGSGEGSATRIDGALTYSEPTEPLFAGERASASVADTSTAPSSSSPPPSPAPQTRKPPAEIAVLAEADEPAVLVEQLEPLTLSQDTLPLLVAEAPSSPPPAQAADAAPETDDRAAKATREARDRLRAMRN